MKQLTPENVLYHREVQTHPDLMGTAGLNPKPYSVSSPRLHMFSSQIGQKPAILHGEPPLLYTGFERAHAEYLHVIKTPANIVVKEIINKYANYTPEDQNPPVTLVIFERMDTKKIDVLEIPHNYCNHQTFGFRYIRTPVMNRLYINQCIDEGTILAKPITLNDDGDWCYGRNVRMALIPSEAGIEDGLCISESTARNFAMYGYGTEEMRFGKNKILLNTYGDDKIYRPFPTIGEIIRPDGLIMASRDFDPMLAPANMTRRALSRPNNTDATIFGVPGARIVDIRIIRGSNQSNNIPPEIDEYLMKHWNRDNSFHHSILKLHQDLKREYRTEKYGMTAQWHSFVKNALFVTNVKPGVRKEAYRGSPLDDYHIIIQYEYIHIPNRGQKFTDRQAGKAVATLIKADAKMPRDAKGRHMDAYMDDSSTSNRMNSPRMDEITINSCAENCVEKIREAYLVENNVDKAWAILRRFFEIISPPSMVALDEITDVRRRIEDLDWIVMDDSDVPEHMVNGIRIASPSDMPIDWVKALPALNAEFPALEDYLWITNDDGTVVRTKYKSLTGKMYLMALERAANKFSATSSAKRQPMGIPVKPSKQARSLSPINDSPTRADGEDETRGHSSIMGSVTMMETYDRNLNPWAHQQECRSIFSSENPSRITNTVPRREDQLDPTVKHQKVIPITGGRVVEIRDHALLCSGVEFIPGEDGDAV